MVKTTIIKLADNLLRPGKWAAEIQIDRKTGFIGWQCQCEGMETPESGTSISEHAARCVIAAIFDEHDIEHTVLD